MSTDWRASMHVSLITPSPPCIPRHASFPATSRGSISIAPQIICMKIGSDTLTDNKVLRNHAATDENAATGPWVRLRV